jgi:hypothetical protein
MYWTAATQFHRLSASDVPDADVAAALDEIEVIERYVDWPPIKARCRALLDGEHYERETA